MQQTNSRQHLLVLKIILLVLILNLTLPFYAGNTTSALDSFAFVHYQGEESNPPSRSEDQVQPPAKVDYSNKNPETTTPVQVIPLPSEQPNPSSSPAPENPPIVSSSPSPGLDTETDPTPKPAAHPNEETPEPDASPSPNDNGWKDEEIPANAGKLLQNLLDQSYRHEEEKVAYLTFDDGPTPSLTNQVLDILGKENIKATFFAIGSSAKRYPELVRRQYEEGHGIGNHTFSHKFKKIYGKPENFVDELLQAERVLQSILGDDKQFRLARFPGGSFGDKLKPFREAVNEAGFGYIDWNSVNGDAESVKSKSPEELLARLEETVYGQSGLIVLMHDAPNKETTVEALPEIIRFLREQGYRFELLPGSR